MQKPNIGDKVKYSRIHANGTVVIHEGIVRDTYNSGAWDSRDTLLWEEEYPERTELIKAAIIPTAKVVFFHEAYDDNYPITDEYAILMDGGTVYRCESGHFISVYDRIVSYDVVVE